MLKISQTETFRTWLADLKDKTAAAVIALRLIRLETGHLGDTKSVGGGISELRIHYGAGYRVYFTQKNGQTIILLCAGNKSSQSRDIQKARRIAERLDTGNE